MRYFQAVKFKEDLFFSGSVEIDCIYNDSKLANKAAGSYVFHSKESFTNVNDGQTDTITFMKTLFELILGENNQNPFFTAISGYGSGKSHFCTAIAAIFANNNNFLEYKTVLQNIEKLDLDVSKNIANSLTKPNIVFAFNGMNDFNLTVKMNQQLRQYLRLSDIDIPLFTDVEEVFIKAAKFVKSNFANQNFQDELKKHIKRKEYNNIQCNLDYIFENIKDESVFALVNDISEEITGNKYIIENYLNPKVILEEISQKLCGDDKPFGRVLIIFDEIGRYIEWLGTKRQYDPSIMQQLYEGIKNSNGKIAFLSFIQFPLTTYFSHLSPGIYATIARYVDRYKSARKYHLSTVLESVFANLIDVLDGSGFNDYSNLQESLLRWQPQLANSIHWTDKNYYINLICKKLIPFHPLTIALLAKLSEYTQKRGPLMILRDLLIKAKNYEISTVPSIYPVSIFDTDFKDDVIKMEQHGLLKTDNVSIYERLVSQPKIERHLKAEDKSFLQAIVVINLLELKPQSKPDYIILLSNLTGFKKIMIESIVDKLEAELGVIKYDEDLFFHQIELDAVGKRDFERFLISKRSELQSEFDYTNAEIFTHKLKDVLQNLNQLDNFNTILFRDITTLEWVFPQTIVDIRANIVDELNHFKNNSENAYMPDTPKGAMIWIYINCKVIPEFEEEIGFVQKTCSLLKLGQNPLQIGFILDTDSELHSAIRDFEVLNNFSSSENEKYAAFIESHRITTEENVKNIYIGLRKDSYFIFEGKVEKSELNYKKIVDNLIVNLYSEPIPFKFDGFAKLRYHNAKKEYIQILKAFSLKDISITEFKRSLPDNTYNRFIGLVGEYSWGIFRDGLLTEPLHPKVFKIFNELKSEFDKVGEENSLCLKDIFNRLCIPPYGMNIYSANLLLTYIFFFFRDRFTFICDNNEYDYKYWISHVNTNDVHYELIKKTKIKFSDPIKLKESAFRLLDEIMDSHSTENILSKRHKIDELLDKFSYDKDINQKIELVKTKIYNAEELEASYKVIEIKLDDIEHYYSSADGIPDILKTILELEKDWKELSEKSRGSALDVQNIWLDNFDKVFNNTKVFLKANFEKWFTKNNWPRNHNVEAFNMFCKKIAKSLYALELNEYGRIVNDTVKKVSRSYDYLSSCQQRITSFQNMIIPENYKSYKIYQKKINEFIKEINNSNLLANSQKQYYSEQLNSVLGNIKNRIKELDNNVGAIYDIVAEKKFSTLDELKLFQSKIKTVLQLISEDHTDYQILSEIFENADNLINEFSSSMSKDLLFDQISDEVNNLMNKFKDNLDEDPDYITCSALFYNLEKYLKDKLNEKIEQWMSVIPKEEFSTLVESKLEQIGLYISNPPVYLRDGDIKKLVKYKEEIISILDESAEGSIIRLFNSINDAQKKKQLVRKLDNLLGK